MYNVPDKDCDAVLAFKTRRFVVVSLADAIDTLSGKSNAGVTTTIATLVVGA